MTPYERFKSALITACILFLAFVGGEVHGFVKAWTSTPTQVNATLSSLSRVGPQAVATLQSLQGTTSKVGNEATRTLRAASKVGSVLSKAGDTLDLVNAPCGTTKPCGTLADANRTLATVRGTFGQIEVAANHEDKNLSTLDAQEAQLYLDFHATTTNLNSLVASPDIARFLKSSADTSTEVAAIATDVHKEADKLTAPVPWWHKIGNYTTTGVNVACLVTHSCPF